jgi:polyisoprenoid-binding protein YceI
MMLPLPTTLTTLQNKLQLKTKMKISQIVPLFIAAIMLFSCGEKSNQTGSALQSFDACSCATVADQNSADYKKCKELRVDAKFEADYQKCKMANASGIADTSRITIQNSANATNLKSATNGSYSIDAATSNVRWSGEKITGKKHTGTISVKKGVLHMSDGQITGGEIILDMNTLTNLDLSGESKTKLETHLKSDDFFAIAKFPEASYLITSATAKSAIEYELTGKLNIKGISKEVKSNVVVAPNGDNINVGGGFVFDRSQFDVRYGSDKFFDNLGNDLIKNDILLTLDLKGIKAK